MVTMWDMNSHERVLRGLLLTFLFLAAVSEDYPDCYNPATLEYHGTASMACPRVGSCAPCLPWASVIEQGHLNASDYPGADLVENYCRSLGNTMRAPWCFYQASDGLIWQEHCRIPPCNVHAGCMNGSGEMYRDAAMHTESGHSCLRWDEVMSWAAVNNESFAIAGLAENFCRNPDNSSAPWCYYLDPNTNTTLAGFCDIPQCTSDALTKFTRRIQVYISGRNLKYVTGFNITAEDCALSCLGETSFVCRSFEFREQWPHTDRKCILTNESLYSLDRSDNPSRGHAIDLFTRIDTVCDAYLSKSFPASCPFAITEDLNVTASSVYSNAHTPDMAHVGRDTWWRPTESAPSQWLQVVFKNRVLITAVAVQGAGERAPYWVEYFKLEYSKDGHLWWPVSGQDNASLGFRANGEASCVKTVLLKPQIRARIVRIIPTKWRGEIAMRFNVFGCLDDDCDVSAGMVDGSLHDGWITASSYSQSQGAPHSARPNPLDSRGTGWVPLTSDAGQWLQVDFQRERLVHTIVTQGCGNADWWVTSYSVAFSVGETGFTTCVEEGLEKVFQANFDRYSLVSNKLKHRQVMRTIKLMPVSWKDFICLRADFIGCTHSTCSRRLGMESGQIADEQISASSQYLANSPQRARLYLESSDDPTLGCWRASVELAQEWLQIDLLTFHTVTGVITQGLGNPTRSWWVTLYAIKYESREWEGIWRDYTNLDGDMAILTGNSDGNAESFTRFKRPFVTRKVRFLPLSWQSALPCMRVEVIGCPLEEVGEICGEGALRFDGFCIGTVQSRGPDSCDAIFAQGSELLKITSRTMQEFIVQNHDEVLIEYASEYLIGLRMDTHDGQFRWWDGTPMTYENFVDFELVLDESGAVCVVLDEYNNMRWRKIECAAISSPHAAMCQRDINECSQSGICPSVCENVPGGYHCLCPTGYFYQSGACLDICSQLNMINGSGTVAQRGQSCLTAASGPFGWSEARATCESLLADVAGADEIQELQLERDVWVTLAQTRGAVNETNDCFAAKVVSATSWETQQVSCNETFSLVCAKAFADVRCEEILLRNATTVETRNNLGYIHSLNYPPWYNSGSSCRIHIQGPERLVVRFTFLRMDLRRGMGAEECLDSLTIEDELPNYGTLLRGRYCGTRSNLMVITRSNDVTMMLQMGSLTADMALELGFVAFYEMIDCSKQLCELGCGGRKNLMGTTGNLSTPKFPATLPPFSICQWAIHATPGSYVKLSFPEFKVVQADGATGECRDAVYVFDTADYNPRERIQGFCDDAPPLIISTSSEVTVVFWTGLESPSLGFRAEYTATELPGCGVGPHSSSSFFLCQYNSAVIASRGYPHYYPPNMHCTWHINTLPATYIELDFHEFDVASGQDCSFDHVAIFDGRTSNGTSDLLGQFCNSVRPPDRIHSSRNDIVIVFRTYGFAGSGGRDKGSGFYAVYRTLHFEPLARPSETNDDYTCPEEWDIFNGHCYIFHNQSSNLRWRDAEMECVKDQAHLVSIRDIREVNYIHEMLTSRWFTGQWDTYIGLTDALSEGHFRWTDGYPMSYADWHLPNSLLSKERPQPDGDVLEDCTMITLHSIKSTANWHDVSCASRDARQFICKKPAAFRGLPTKSTPNPPDDFMMLTPEDMQHECRASLKRCDSGECTQLPFDCPGQLDDQRKQAVYSNPADDFVCETTGKRISISFYCDYVQHCADGSDESDCEYPACGTEEARCDNGQCIAKAKMCDLIADCADASDEAQCETCNSGFQCYDGTCLPDSAVCDGMKHCPGTRWEDEPPNCLPQCDDSNQLRCSNGACANRSTTCIYDVDEYGLQIGCRDVTHLRHCESSLCPPWTLKCPSSYCIPLRMRCDGKFDCPFGEDELYCDVFQCPGAYRCHGATHAHCLSPNELCDGVRQCPEGDDEAYCDMSCPFGCRCHGYSVECEGVSWSAPNAALLPNQARLIKLILLKHQNSTRAGREPSVTKNGTILHLSPGDFPFLAKLDVSHNAIKEIPDGIFKKSTNLLHLSLAHNDVTHLKSHTFQGLQRLLFLDLTGNPLAHIASEAFIDLKVLPTFELTNLPVEVLVEGTFNGMDSLNSLSLEGSALVQVEPGSFTGLHKLRMLNIRHTRIQNILENMFTGLERLQTLYSDRYLFCCLIGKIEECTPPADQFSSCEDLMRNYILRIFIWILGISALLGNALVFFWRLKNGRNERNKVQDFLILNLAVSDFLMGVYMVMIASADLRYRNIYILHAEEWEASTQCQVAGLISVLSSEVSVVMLVVISLDRFWCVMFPFKRVRLGVKSSRVVAAVAWAAMLVVSIVPVLGLPYFAGSFYGRTGVCLALPLTQDKMPGWEYSISFFLFFNVACFIVILISYTGIYLTVRSTSRRVQSNKKSQEAKMARRMLLILCTDFCCWMPVIIMGILSLAGQLVIPSVVYAWTAVFILPLNSAINPYLYTISAMQLRNRKVGVTKSTVVTVDAQGSADNSPPCRILLSEVTRGQATLRLDEAQLNQLADELKDKVQAMHRSGIAHGDISQSKVMLQQSDGATGNSWTLELLMPKTQALFVVNRGGASTDTGGAVETDLKKLNLVIALMKRKLGKE